MSEPLCDCGHDAFDHSPNITGGGNTPCWSYRNEDSQGFPTDRCECREYNPVVAHT